MIRCPKCDAEVPPEDHYCGACGAALVSASEAVTRTSRPDVAPTAGSGGRERWQVIEELFDRIVELDPSERSEALDRECAGDPKLRAEVEALLGADGAAAESFLEQPVAEVAPTLMKEIAESPPSGTAASPSSDYGRFIPGTLLAKRYRITGLLGRGGMGEVYRADDLKLGEPVALKFLPKGLEQDAGILERFLNEVRMALKVSHPNVCRVRDIGEFEGQHYISMEFVDGEDLAALIRRIGRLPKDKAVQVARQLCAGLAAAHEQGVLHRDLKPSNVMIDGRGQVKITDFGLAGVDDAVQGTEALAGTPAYMSPEQWEGTGVSVRSDLYALGLVLYEVFTGERAYKGKSAEELRQLREAPPPTPSSVMAGIDPTVEQVILKCLEKEPSRRPASALAVSAALPGGDPLAEALAAGETPLPEQVAEGGSVQGVGAGLAVGLFALALLLVGVWVAVADQVHLMGFVRSEKSPDVLVERAQQIIRDVGYPEPPVDSLFDFAANADYLDHVRDTDSSLGRWRVLRQPQPAAMHFRYRQSPDYISKLNLREVGEWMTDPPVDEPGEIKLLLDLEGRLLSFLAVPPDPSHLDESRTEIDWEPMLRAAGFDPAALTPQESTWLPPQYSDARAAWTGFYPDAEEVEIRIEAAAVQGRPVAMQLLEPWSRANAEAPEEVRSTAAGVMSFVWHLGILGVGLVLARRNVQSGRGDRKTALRFALYVGALTLLGGVLASHHVLGGREIDLVLAHLASAALITVVTAVWYLATEPYARKLWPHLLVTWVRFVGGKWRDPLIGRDILVGLALGTALALLRWFQVGVANQLAGLPSDAPLFEPSHANALRGVGSLTASVLGAPINAMLALFSAAVFLVILRMLVRKTWLAVALVWTTFTVLGFAATSGSAVDALVQAAFPALFLFGLFRFGFLTLGVALTFFSLFFDQVPMTHQISSWYASGTVVVLALFLGAAIYAVRASLAGRRILRDEFEEAGA